MCALVALSIAAIGYRFAAISSLTSSKAMSKSLELPEIDPAAASHGAAGPMVAMAASSGGTCEPLELPASVLRAYVHGSADTDTDDDLAPVAKALSTQCHAEAHVELEGGVVRWGSSHVVPSAAACCEACRAEASTAKPERGCNAWIFCAKEGACGAQKAGECWLKRVLTPDAPLVTKSKGSHVGWVSGTLFAPVSATAAARGGRSGPLASSPIADGLSVHRAGGMAVGLRKETASVELLAPDSASDFSFVLPLRDPSLHLGRKTDPVLDRTQRQFAHLGDLTFRVCAPPSPGTPSAPAGEEVAAGDAAAARARCPSHRTFSTHARRNTAEGTSKPAQLPGAGDVPGAAARAHGRAPGRVLGSAELTSLLPPDSPVRAFFWVEAAPKAKSADPALDPAAGEAAEEVQLWWQLALKPPGERGAPSAADASAGAHVGSLAFPITINQFFSYRTLEQVASACSFGEAYVGLHGGYVQATRARGQGPVLLLAPAPGAAPGAAPGTRFEAWRPLREADRLEPNYMYESTYELMVHTLAYAGHEWRGAEPWNDPSSARVTAQAPLTRGLRLVLARTVDDVEAALHAAAAPVAVPMPAPTLTTEMTTAALWVRPPAGLALALPDAGVRVTPPGCVRLGAPTAIAGAATNAGWLALPVAAPRALGRCRVELRFTRGAAPADGGVALRQTVHLFVTKPARELVGAFSAVASAVSWRGEGTADPWHRFPAFFGTDAGSRSAVLEQSKVFMAGLSDEAGLAMPLAVAVKQLGMPSAEQVSQLEAMVHQTFLAPRNASAAERARYLQSGADFGVRRSMLYWSDAVDKDARVKQLAPALYAECHRCWPKCWWLICWSEPESLKTWRAYNYPHVAAVYWALYRVGRRRTPPLTRRAPPDWYLAAAARTALGMWTHGLRLNGLAQWGLMVGSVFVAILRDVEAEAADAPVGEARDRWLALGKELRAAMRARVGRWRSMAYPLGSEFPWDDTSSEEVYAWLRYFGHGADATSTVQAILAFATLSPHWGFSGAARRYWDFGINGALNLGNEREMHHYAGTLNALPVRAEYEARPERAHLLRIFGAAALGSLSTIDAESGFVSMAWHSDPSHLKRDNYSADFGPGFYGAAMLSGSYVAHHAPFGWVCALCDLERTEGGQPVAPGTLHDGGGDGSASPSRLPEAITVVPRDAYRRRLFLAPPALALSVDGATIERAELQGDCTALHLAAAPPGTTHASLEVELTRASEASALPQSVRVSCCADGTRPCAARTTRAAMPARVAIELSTSSALGRAPGAGAGSVADGSTVPRAGAQVKVCWTS